MFIVKVSSQGRITIPLQLRKQLGIKPGDRVLIETSAAPHSAPLSGALLLRPAPNFFDFAGAAGKALPSAEERRLMEKAVARHVNQNVRK